MIIIKSFSISLHIFDHYDMMIIDYGLIYFICFSRVIFLVTMNSQCGHRIFFPSCTNFICVICLKRLFLCRFVFAMCGISCLHGLIVCVSEDFFCMLLCICSVYIYMHTLFLNAAVVSVLQLVVDSICWSAHILVTTLLSSVVTGESRDGGRQTDGKAAARCI